MVATCHRADHETYCALLAAEVDRFIAVVSGAPPDASVPSCPGWDVGTVASHVGGLHRWAETLVRTLSPKRLGRRDIDLQTPEDPAHFPEWLASGRDQLLRTLHEADPDAAVWAWGADKHARFWGRRMLFETVVHRVDIEQALGRQSDIAADVALDGADEFLDNLPHAAYFAPNVKELRGSGESLCLEAADSDTVWTVTLRKDGFDWSHEPSQARARVSGSAADLLLLLYGRLDRGTDRFERDGEDELLRRWFASSAI